MRYEPKQKIPTYDEMLEMSEEDSQKWILIRVKKPSRDKLLLEMIEHEARTKSFYKTVDHKLSKSEQTILDVFNPQKSAEIIAIFEKVDRALKDSGEQEPDLLKHAIFAKLASDITSLGTRIEFEKLIKNYTDGI